MWTCKHVGASFIFLSMTIPKDMWGMCVGFTRRLITSPDNRTLWSKSLPCTSTNLFSTASQYLENEFIMWRILLTWKPLRTRSNLFSNKSNIWTPQSNSILKIRNYNFLHQCVWVCVSWCVWQRAGKRENWTLTCFLRVCVFTIRVVSIVCVRLNVIEGE